MQLLAKIQNTIYSIKKNNMDQKRKQLADKYAVYYLDDLSKKLIQARVNYYRDYKLKSLLTNYIQLGYDKWNIPELDIYEENNIFYLFGEGDRYEYCALLLKHSKYNKRFKMIGTNISIWENAGKDAVLISIASDKIVHRKRIVELAAKYPERLVHVNPVGAMLIGVIGLQYFDVFSPKQNEVFINAGAFHGETDIDFVKWCNNSYKKIYAFEPMKKDAEICKKHYAENNITNIELLCKGTWSQTGYISFSEGISQGRIDENGTNRIETIKIDDAVSNLEEKVTFIKMDIEGAELKALQGARETILKDKPRMAICIYHKPEDLYEIPGYILSLVPEYRFKVRQYTSMTWETVLYAAVENEW